MRLVFLHARIATLTLARHPSFVVPTICFPALFFVFFASPAQGRAATYALCSFAVFAALGVAFFQFGVGIAVERESPWEHVLRVFPVSPTARIGARLLSASIFSAIASGLVIVTALLMTDASLSAAGWVRLTIVLAAATGAFALLGIAIGYWASPRGALPIANILYFSLAYAGGLWIRPEHLPAAVQVFAPYLPTRRLASLLFAIVGGRSWRVQDWAVLALFALGFAVAAVVGYRRDERNRFR